MIQLTSGKRAASKMRGAQKRIVRGQRDSDLKPYEQVKLIIDDCLIQTKDAKRQLDDFIAEVRAEEAEAEGGKFCPQCGEPVGEGDKFCRECGQKL